MGVTTETSVEGEELGEPVGSIHVLSADALRATTVEADELPLVIDEVPGARDARRRTPRRDAVPRRGELRLKESDRLLALVEGIRALGGQAAVEGDDLVIEGGGLRGGEAVVRRRSPDRDGVRGRCARGRSARPRSRDGGGRRELPGLRGDPSILGAGDRGRSA